MTGGLSAVSDRAVAAEVNDSDALRGVSEVHAVFDLNISTPDELVFYLKVIKQTYEDLVRQGQKADCIIAIRGGAVRLVTTENWSFAEEDQEKLKEAAAMITELKQAGLKFEACSVALGLFKVDSNTLLPEVKAVGNTFVSLIGYQTRGYVVVPVK